MGMDEMLRGKEPFTVSGAGREAVLCLHGFTGSPGIYRKLAPALGKAGYTVSVPLLPGHGTAPADMLGVTLADWRRAAEGAYLALAEEYGAVHVVGLSLGGALACLLAADHPELRSLVLLAPAFAINPYIRQRLGLDGGGAQAPGETMVPLPTRAPTGGEMDECIFGYPAFPVSAIAQLHAAGEAAVRAVPRVTAPTCLMYTEADQIVDPAQCARQAGRIPGLRETVPFAESEHNLLLGTDRQEVQERTLAFLRRNALE